MLRCKVLNAPRSNNQHNLSLKKLKELQQRVERKSVARRQESLTEEEVVEVLRTGTIELIEPDKRPGAG